MSIRPATLFVLLVWAGMLVWANAYVATWAEKFPIGDESALWTLLPPLGEFTWKTLLQPHNGHFLPLPKLIHFALYEITGDLRPAMFLQVELLGATSLGLILLARRVRGRTEWTDVLFPLFLLHTGNAMNLLSGFQLSFTLPTVLAAGMLAAAAISPDLPRRSRALWTGLGLVLLPLCGGAGNLQAPALMIWLAWAGWRGVRSAEPAERSGGRILLASVGITFAICVAGAGLVASAPRAEGPASVKAILVHAAALLSLGIGRAAQDTWPASGWLLLSLSAAAIWLLVRGFRSEAPEPFRRIGIIASMTGIVCLALGASVVRARLGWVNGFALRYVLLTTPLLCGIHMAWVAYGGRVGRRIMETLLALIAIAALPMNARDGEAYARTQRKQAQELEALVQNGARVADILHAYFKNFQLDPHRSLSILAVLAQERRPPFDVGPSIPPALFEFPPLDRAPSSIESEQPPSLRWIEGQFALLVRDGTRIRLPLHAGEHSVSARFEVPAQLAERPKSPGVRISIQIAPTGGLPQTLFERELDPRLRESDRGLQTQEIEIPPHGECELWLTTESPDEERAGRSWVYWVDVAIH